MNEVEMSRRTVLVASLVGILSAPMIMAIRAMLGRVDAFEVAFGSFVGVAFYALTALIVLRIGRTQKEPLRAWMFTYGAKFALLGLVAFLVPISKDFDRRAFSVGLVTSALVFLTIETAAAIKSQSQEKPASRAPGN